MLSSDVLQITQQALWLVVTLAGPPVVVAALVGIVIAFFQAATQLQEQTFQYAAKFFAIVATIFFTATMIGSSLYRFTDRLFSDFHSLVG